MRIFKRNENKETGKLPMGRKSRKAFAVYVAAVLCMTCFTTTAFAASDQRANGFLTLAGGVIITFAKEILTLIAG